MILIVSYVLFIRHTFLTMSVGIVLLHGMGVNNVSSTLFRSVILKAPAAREPVGSTFRMDVGYALTPADEEPLRSQDGREGRSAKTVADLKKWRRRENTCSQEHRGRTAGNQLKRMSNSDNAGRARLPA